jgi:hypothetical protein
VKLTREDLDNIREWYESVPADWHEDSDDRTYSKILHLLRTNQELKSKPSE